MQRFFNLFSMETNVNAPAMQLRTDRGLIKMIFLSLITFGIYSIVVESHISEELNLIASRHDGRRTMHFCLIYFIFSGYCSFRLVSPHVGSYAW